jgi:hypothetical protein
MHPCLSATEVEPECQGEKGRRWLLNNSGPFCLEPGREPVAGVR